MRWNTQQLYNYSEAYAYGYFHVTDDLRRGERHAYGHTFDCRRYLFLGFGRCNHQPAFCFTCIHHYVYCNLYIKRMFEYGHRNSYCKPRSNGYIHFTGNLCRSERYYNSNSLASRRDVFLGSGRGSNSVYNS